MSTENVNPDPARSLRRRAEARLEQQPHHETAPPPDDVQEIIHELEVHQVELSMQNETLREAQLSLQRSLDRYTSLFDSAPIGYVIIDKDGTVQQANLTFARMAGIPRDTLTGKPFVETVTEEDRDAFYIHRRRLFKTRVPQVNELRLRSDSDAFFWARLESTLTEDADGRTVGRVAVSDISERRRMADQLRESEKLAALGQLTSGIARDFSDTLSSILLNAQYAEADSEATPQTRTAIHTISEEARQAADQVQRLLDFSRKSLIDTAPYDLGKLVRANLGRIRQRLPETVTLTLDLPDAPCTARVDATRMRQVLVNLVDNARDAMPDGGTLRIAVERDGHRPPPVDGLPPEPDRWACLIVSDTGTGMSRTVEAHLFEPFFTTKGSESASGLGLAQVYGIVKQHGGYIHVDTALGQGTTFNIHLPLVETEHEPVQPQATGPSRGRGERLLLAEDNEPLRYAIRDMLTALGYTITATADGQAALEAAQAASFDLVITDLVMPRLNGEGLLHGLQAMADPPPAIAITGHVTNADASDLRAAGFSSVLSKPFAVEELTAAIRTALNRRTQDRLR